MRRILASLTALLLIATVASAQQQERRGRGGAPNFAFMGGQGSSASLLGIPEVQKEITVTDEQKKQIDELMAELREGRGSARTNFDFNELQKLSQEERAKRLAEAQKNAEAANKKTDDRLAKILDAKQLERLAQLRLQQQGAGAISRPEIAKQLELTEEQQEKIRKIQQESRPQGGPGGFGAGGGGGNFQDLSEEEQAKMLKEFQKRREAMQKQQEKASADILAVLTDAQKEKWGALKGKEFKFPERRGFGPGGRGGPDGAPQERRRPEPKKDNTTTQTKNP